MPSPPRLHLLDLPLPDAENPAVLLRHDEPRELRPQPLLRPVMPPGHAEIGEGSPNGDVVEDVSLGPSVGSCESVNDDGPEIVGAI